MIGERRLVLIVSFLLAMNAAPALVEGGIFAKSEATKSETVEKDGKEIGYEDSPFGFLGPVSGAPMTR
ncbi:hypothetical protein KA005_81235, partial [bacterium]|nr:hypothetical protein [bacterium]